MKVPDDERRLLDEIEEHLSQESPRLAEEFRRHRVESVPRQVTGALIAISVGLAAAVIGTEAGSVVLTASGLATAVGVPTAIIGRYLSGFFRE